MIKNNILAFPSFGDKNAKLVFDSVAMLQPGGTERFGHLYKAGYRLRGIVSLKKEGRTPFDPIAVALLKHKEREGVFVSVVHERGGEWICGEASPYVEQGK